MRWREYERVQMCVLLHQENKNTLYIPHATTILGAVHEMFSNNTIISYLFKTLNRIGSEVIPGKNHNLHSFKYKLTERTSTKQAVPSTCFCCYQTGDAL